MSIIGTLWLVAETVSGVEETAEEAGFGLNFDILESNIINLAIVIAVLIYFGRGFLGNILSNRQSTIETAIREAEQRKKEAAASLADQQQKLAQAQAEASRIRSQAEESASKAKADILSQAERDIERLRETAAQEVGAEQDRVIAELRQRVAALAIERVEAELPSRLNDDVQRHLVDRSIAMMGGS